jgi:SAM-dependent methyltransferase
MLPQNSPRVIEVNLLDCGAGGLCRRRSLVPRIKPNGDKIACDTQIEIPTRLEADDVNSDLYHHPALYDALLPVRAHLPYYAELAGRASGDILELACGTGQLTVPLASAGLQVTGLDLAEPMLSAARERAAAAQVSVEHLPGDMRHFDLGRRFALIFIARNSLLHLHSTEDILATFSMVRRHLAPEGTFAFDIFNPKVRLLARPPNQRYPVVQVETEAFGTLSVEETIDYDAEKQVSFGSWYISAPGKPDAWVLPLALRSIFPQELPLLLAAGGFHLQSRAGDVDRTPFNSSSRSQVCLCKAAV